MRWESTLSDSLKEQFCIMVQKSEMAENFDAQTGTALRDPAYTWTCSIFLLFAHEHAESGATSYCTRMNTLVAAREDGNAIR
jgi:hypothetical protein